MEEKQALQNGISNVPASLLKKPFIRFLKAGIDQSVADRFEHQVARHPSRLALKTPTGQLTYEGLNRAANRIARALAGRCGQGGEPVALFLGDGAQLIPAMLAALKAGRPYVSLDPSFPLSKNAAVVRHSRPCLIVTCEELYPVARQLSAGRPSPLVLEETAGRNPSESENLGLPVPPGASAYIIYTSGSTGRPKGVFQDHRNVLHNVMRCTNMLHISPDDRLSLLWSCSFAASVPNIFGALLNGASLFPFDIKKEGISGLADWLVKEEITIYHSVPSVYRHLLSTLKGTEDFSRLRLIKLSGEPVRKGDVELYRRHFPENCVFHVSYASTETNIIRQFFCDHHMMPGAENSGSIWETVPAGYEVEDMEILILDENGKDAGVNCAGEIAVRSPFLPPSYYGKDSHCESPFLTDERDGNFCRIYRTGDMGYLLPDGCLIHLGRKDRQVKIRGYRVELSEVERALNVLPQVKEAAVMGRDDPYGGKLLAAYVVPKEREKKKSLTAGELRLALKDSLPDYMVPSCFVFLDALPLTLGGKVDRRALPDPGRTGLDAESDFVDPGTPSEVMLAGLWNGILGTERVGVFDNFFDLGGHSLLVARMAAGIKKMTGKSIPIIDILQRPTIRQLAGILDGEERPPRWFSPSIPGQDGRAKGGQARTGSAGQKPPLFWMGINPVLPDLLGPGQQVYGVILQGQYGYPATYSSIEELASHHLGEILEAQPKGPYLLGGFCFSGLVALEMSRQLQDRGEKVELLCLVDPPRQCLPSEVQCPSGSGPLQLHRINFRLAARRYMLSALCRTYRLAGRPIPQRYTGFHSINTSRKYRARPYQGKVVVFLADEACGAQPDWSLLAGAHVHVLPGINHDGIYDKGKVEIWARLLAGYLGQVRGKDR